MHFLHFKCFFPHIFDVHMVVTSLFSGKWNILNHIFFLIFQQILFLELENSVIFVVRRVNFLLPVLAIHLSVTIFMDWT